MAGSFFLNNDFFEAVDDMWAWWMARDPAVRQPPEHYDGGRWTLPEFDQLLTAVCGQGYRSSGLETTYSAVAARGDAEEAYYLRGIELTLFHKLRDVGPSAIPVHVSLVRKAIQPGDTFLTFNYDPLIEHALLNVCNEQGSRLRWSEHDGYAVAVVPFEGAPGPPPTEPSNVSVLKLHGSVDWLSPFGRTPEPPFRALRLSSRSIRGQGFISRKTDNVPYRPVIVPPLPKKLYEEMGLESIWERAELALRKASSLTVIGYSLPSTDDRPRELLRNAAAVLDPNTPVTFVTRSDRAAFWRLRDIFPAARLVEGGFSSYVRSLPAPAQ